MQKARIDGPVDPLPAEVSGESVGILAPAKAPAHRLVSAGGGMPERRRPAIHDVIGVPKARSGHHDLDLERMGLVAMPVSAFALAPDHDNHHRQVRASAAAAAATARQPSPSRFAERSARRNSSSLFTGSPIPDSRCHPVFLLCSHG